MVENSLMGLIGIVIAVSIFLGLGLVILDSSTSDCSGLDGFNSSNPSASTSYAGLCEDNNSQIMSAYGMVMLIIIVLSAIVVLATVRML
jgi:hypothetical protein